MFASLRKAAAICIVSLISSMVLAEESAAPVPAPAPEASEQTAPSPTPAPVVEATPAVAPQPTPAAIPVAEATPTPAPVAEKDHLVETSLGFWYMPTTSWAGKTSSTSGGGELHFSINNSPFTTYEGNIAVEKVGLSLGVSVDVDNNVVGKLNRLMGYIGAGGFFLRLQTTNLKGAADWQGTALTGQTSHYNIDTSYQNIELVRAFGQDKSSFWGLAYSTLTLPEQISVWGNINNVYTGYDSVDPAGAMKIYSLLFGSDSLNWNSIRRNDGFGFWAYTQDMFGWGSQTVSAAVEDRISKYFGGRTIPTSLDTLLIDYTLTLGAKWERHSSTMAIGLGLGFNFHGTIWMGGWNAEGSGSNDLAAYTTTMLSGSGPEFKLIASW